MKLLSRSAVCGLVLGGVLVVGGGCGPSANTGSSSTGSNTAAANPWPKFASAVRATPDPKGVRSAAAELTAGLSNAPADARPKAADPAALDAVAAALKLTDAEKKTLAGGELSPLDANYLGECLYLSDAAAGLGVTAADPAGVRADAAFRFVCRQVVLAPAAIGQVLLPPVPPSFVLSRGSGTGLERAVAFVALCRQLDLDAYYLGPPAAAGRGWMHQGPAAPGQPPKGPFWGVGVQTADGVLVFDPWRGEAVPGKVASRPVTLAELKADPSACPWVSDKGKAWDVTADDIKEGGLFLSPPLPALSPRMLFVQQRLKEAVGVRLAVDWAAAVKAAEGAAGGAPVGGWNPAGDPFSPVRALGSFLPKEQGGLDPTPEKDSLFTRYNAARLPMDRIQATPPEVTNRTAESRLRQASAATYGDAFLVPPTPREKIQRGQYNVAVSELVKRRDDFNRLLSGREDDLTEWYKSLSAAYDRYTAAQGTPGEAVAREEAEKFLRGGGQFQRAVGGMIAEVGVGEVNYLLALAAHEQAEAAEATAARAEREKAGAAEARVAAKAEWAKASRGWKRYAEYADAQAASFPGRKENADALAARADKLAK